MSILDQNFLTLDFWQDKVTYAQGDYAKEMEQDALLKEAQTKR